MPSDDGQGRPVTQQRLIVAAAQVFAERGIPGASVESICARARFTRGAFYSNFASKTDLCIALLGHCLAEARAGADALAATPETPGSVADVLATYHRLLGDRRTWLALQLEFDLLALRDDDFRTHYTDFSAQSAAIVTQIITLVLRRAGRLPVIDPGRLAEQFSAECRGAWLAAGLGAGSEEAEFVRCVGDVLERGTTAGDPAAR